MTDNIHYIHAGWLIDGGGGPILRNMLLAVSRGRWIGIEPWNQSDAPNPLLVTNLSHCVILPPLIDSHVHLCMSGSIDQKIREEQLSAGYEELSPVIAEHLRHQFSHGVLAVRDGGERLGIVRRHLEEHGGADRVPVEVKISGRAYHRQGRYGTLIGRSVKPGESPAEAFEHDAQIVDQVKIINSGLNSLKVFGHETSSQFTPEELAEIVKKSHRRGRKVMVHANGRIPVQLAVEAGCDSIEHGFFMGRENLALMADRETFWIPTAYTMRAYADSCEYSRTEADRGVIEKTLEHQLEQVFLARQLGVKIALGTDAGSTGVLHGEAVVEEMKLLMRAGCSLVEVIQYATEHSALLSGLENRLGRISLGKPAHFLAARGTPAQLPRKLSYLEAIYLDGRPSTQYRRY